VSSRVCPRETSVCGRASIKAVTRRTSGAGRIARADAGAGVPPRRAYVTRARLRRRAGRVALPGQRGQLVELVPDLAIFVSGMKNHPITAVMSETTIT
jgi:hypothetical protein